MPPLSDIALIPVSIGALLAVMATVRWAAPRLGIKPELQRKLVHVATGLYALTLPFTFQTTQAVLLLIVLSVCVLMALRLPMFAQGGVATAIHAVERKSFGEIYLALAAGLVFWMAAGQLILFVLPILVLTLSDAAAALAGTRYGSRHFAVQAGTKSWEGVAMFFMVTLILSMILLLLMTDIDRLNVIVLSMMIAAFGALVEADSWGGLDNLFVPVGVHLLLASHLATPPVQLGLLALGFVTALVVIIAFAESLGLKPHSARAYLVLLFLMFAVTAPYNAILPAIAVFAHMAARSANPCRSRYPDLDMIAVSAGIALFWLFTGEFFERNALNVYNMTFAAMAVALITLSAQRWPLASRIAVAAGAFTAAGSILRAIEPLNAPASGWSSPLLPWAIAALGTAAVAAVVWPGFFSRYRCVRTLAIAAPVPLLLFALKGLYG